MSDQQHFYVTTPIYYVNDQPHIGHAYTTILADVLARYHRLLGVPTHFLTGTDEHGQKVQQAATKRGVSPQEHVDTYFTRFTALWQHLGITNDDFIRTTEPRHTRIVQQVLADLFERDEIYRAEYDGWYCVTCERFYTEKDLADGMCPEKGCHKPVEKITETNYFFRMSKYQDWLIRYIEEHPQFIQPDYRRNETLGFLRKPLTDLCISRPKTRMSWGIELPFDKDFVTYVWFDALLNYVSAIGYGKDAAFFGKWWPASMQLIGKDILTTHTVYWPTMLHAMGVPLPETVFAHGWWLIGHDKMSKSAGNVVNPMELAEKYGVDAFRYFLMSEMVLGQDASFTQDGFVRRYNADLANDLGNLLSRVLRMTVSHFDGKVPPCGALGVEDEQLRDVTVAAVAGMRDAVGRMRIDQGLAGLAGAIREANRYLEVRQPWTLAKQGEEARELLGTTLYCAAETLRMVSGMLYPVMPAKMASLRAALGAAEGEPDYSRLSQWGELVRGTALDPIGPLYPRIQDAVAEDKAEAAPAAPKAVGQKKEAKPAKAELPEGVISYDTFSQVDLRVARILAAATIEGADKLLCLQVETGGEQRQIVAGIAKSYKPDALVGKQVVIVANLAPARIRGVASQGMLLAADAGDQLRLVTVDAGAEPGAKVR
jgi:methionyl-tRNA synthetase